MPQVPVNESAAATSPTATLGGQGSNANILGLNPLFKHLEGAQLRVLSAYFVSSTYAPGTFLFKMGDPGESCFVVKRGKVELSLRDHSGDKMVLAEFGPGELFGEISLLDNGPRTATAMVLEETELLELKREELTRYLENNPTATIGLITVVGARLRKANEQLRGRVIRNPNLAIEQEFSLGQKIAWRITEASGSFAFLVVNVLLFAGWILWNSNLIPGITAFDPYPFGFLTMAVSLEAIVLSIAVLLSQNLQAAREKVKGEIEYEVNLQAELEVAHLHEKVDDLNAEVLSRLHRLEKLLESR
jgi:uncharacterized membrane protein